MSAVLRRMARTLQPSGWAAGGDQAPAKTGPRRCCSRSDQQSREPAHLSSGPSGSPLRRVVAPAPAPPAGAGATQITSSTRAECRGQPRSLRMGLHETGHGGVQSKRPLSPCWLEPANLASCRISKRRPERAAEHPSSAVTFAVGHGRLTGAAGELRQWNDRRSNIYSSCRRCSHCRAHPPPLVRCQPRSTARHASPAQASKARAPMAGHGVFAAKD